ncbi:MAG: hypothetical protein JNL82_29570 [Myxococcales bacterium]|nr:hypothetical protein [Myxococcales bacterium]
MNRNLWLTLGATFGVGGAVFLAGRRASAASPTPGSPSGSTDLPPMDLAPLPRATDVSGDLQKNWGDTPIDLRPLFELMAEIGKIPGSGRLYSVIAYRESRYVTTAQNGNASGEQDERDSSRAAYKNGKDRNPPLKYGEQAAEFGSGGLFGLLAPYFLWTGVPEVGKKAPLLQAPPELVFQPRAAAFGAVVYMQRLLTQYRIDDHADLKAGWASPSLLKDGRGNEKYNAVRARFLDDAKAIGIDLSDSSTIPPKLDASAWPGVPAVFKALVGALPKDLA